MTTKNSMNLKPFHTLLNIGLALLSLLFSLAAIIAMIVLGTAASALCLLASSGSNASIALYTFGSSTPAIFIAVLTFYLFTKTSIKKTWLIFFFSIPTQGFWLYVSYKNDLYGYSNWPSALNFLVTTIAFIEVLLVKKIKSQT